MNLTQGQRRFELLESLVGDQRVIEVELPEAPDLCQAGDTCIGEIDAVERKIRQRQLTEDGNVKITGRDLREGAAAAPRGASEWRR